MRRPRHVSQSRHFERGPSDSGRRIDHTSYDGSGLVCDDGNQRREGSQSELTTPTADRDQPMPRNRSSA